ncbi:MAG TPA: ATP-binding protein [Polyangiales bacterium]|nr:ATP-binding protein [Polyangiales bacterium]
MSGLVRAVQRLCAARDLDAVVEIVRSTARKLIDADGATFVLRDGEQVFYAAEDAIAPLWQGQRFAASTCISGWAMKHRVLVCIEDIFGDSRVPHDVYLPTFVKSLAMVPVNREEPIAAIGVYWARHHLATERERELLQALADATATALASCELYRGLLAARTELEHASTRLLLALEAGAIGTWDLEPQTGALTCDDKCRELFGTPANAKLTAHSFLDHVHEAERSKIQAALQRALDPHGDGQYDVEYRTTARRWLAARGRALFDVSGAPVRFVGLVRDISYQKQTDAEKVELLRRANAANAAKDEFLAMLGHELRNPLAPILTAVELLKLRGNDSREVTTIDRQCQHLTRLVDDLLDISRVTRGKLELKLSRGLALHSIAAQAIEMAAPLIERQKHVLEVDIDRSIRLDGDEFRLAQLLANLLTNAAKYTSESGLIRIEGKTWDGWALLSVRDTGTGISPELLPRLFAPFVQARQSSERSQGGLGLGLAIARNLAELHGGTIRAESAGPGKGSVFTVRLPLASPLTAATTPSAEPERGDSDGSATVRLLVVDDNEDAAQLLGSSLRSHGYAVDIAADPVEAMEVMRHALPDVALMDIGLPVMDGYELARQLREEWGERCPVLIAVTGYGQDQDRLRSQQAGFALHLVKPVKLASVLDAIESVVPLSWRRRAAAE